ncbi:hypothetical protein MTO96_029518 [Rhipicephalus appendiculatus]
MCPHCPKEFALQRYLRKHVRRHLRDDATAPVPVLDRRPPTIRTDAAPVPVTTATTTADSAPPTTTETSPPDTTPTASSVPGRVSPTLSTRSDDVEVQPPDTESPPDHSGLLARPTRVLREVLRDDPSEESWARCDAAWAQAVQLATAAVRLPPVRTDRPTRDLRNPDNASDIQHLYRRNRRRAVRLILQGPSCPCTIALEDLQTHWGTTRSEREAAHFYSTVPPPRMSSTQGVSTDRWSVRAELRLATSTRRGEVRRSRPVCCAARFHKCLRFCDPHGTPGCPSGEPARATPFTALIADLYHENSTCLIAEDGVSDPVPIRAGLRQGCPLSGLLFNLVVDPIIRDVQGEAEEYNILAYADDLTLLAT